MTHDYRPAVMSGFTYGEEPWTHIGLWDDVENVFVYDSGVSMWYNASCEQDPQCMCERMGPDYHWDPVNETCIQWGPEQECNASGQYWSGILNQCFETEEEMLEAECVVQEGWAWDPVEHICVQTGETCTEEECEPGYVWDYANCMCVPETPADPCEGMSQEECDCMMAGGIWNGEGCDYQSEPDPCAGMDPGECDCLNQGGVWDPAEGVCLEP